MKVIILAGGKGSRLWPFSKEEYPKQFLKFQGEKTLLEITLDRLSKFVSMKDILISTNEAYKKIIEKTLSEKPNILVEPERKNTAPAICFALKYFEDYLGLDEDEPILVIPSDHLINPQDRFLSYLLSSIKMITFQEFFITFGVEPKRAETGYGYIKVGDKLEDNHHFVEAFVEKPSLKKAKQYLLDGKYMWNSGMFLFTRNLFWKELQIHCPEMFSVAEKGFEIMKQNFSSMPNISVDYALMEKTDKMLVSLMDIEWIDIGSWDSVYEIMPKDCNQNVKIGNVVDIDTKNSLIIGKKKLISTIGLKDIIFIETDDTIFLAKKGKSQDMKRLIEKLKLLSLKSYGKNR